jgi:regulator of replication initiation timing
MMHRGYRLAGTVLLALLVAGAVAQRRRDPLTEPEINQLRDTAVEPNQRLKLYVQFARERLVALEQMRADPKVSDRGQETHDRLRDFEDLYDELDDNVDTYADRKDDIRKALKEVIEADTEFQAKLRALKDAAGANKDEVSQYQFVLSDTIDDVDSSAADHRKLLAEQEVAAKHKQLVKP